MVQDSEPEPVYHAQTTDDRIDESAAVEQEIKEEQEEQTASQMEDEQPIVVNA